MLARMVWGTYAVKIEVQMGNCLIVEGSKMLARMVWGNCNHQHGNLTKLLTGLEILYILGAPLRAKKNSGAKKNKKEGNEKRRKREKRKERRKKKPKRG